MIVVPPTAVRFPRGVVSSWSTVDDALTGELGSSILTSGVSAGGDEGTAASPLRRREARGVVCASVTLGLLASALDGRPLRRVEAGEDIMSRSC